MSEPKAERGAGVLNRTPAMSSRDKKRRLPPRPVRVPSAPPIRLIALALGAVALAIWAIVHAYTRPHQPMLVPAPSASPSAPPTEIPVPSVIPIE